MRNIQVESDILTQQKWKSIHRVSFYIATINFFICCFVTIPIFDMVTVIPIYQLLIRVSSLSFIVAEISQYIHADDLQNRRIALAFSVVSIFGNLLYIWCSVIYNSFNDGQLYIVASFLVSLSSELKILKIISQKGKSALRSIKQDTFQFYLQLFLGSATIMFMIGSIIDQLQITQQQSRLYSSISNNIGAILMIFAASQLSKKYESRGYRSFQVAPEILSMPYAPE